jgi:uncharacterized phiE125 gp8 family phage protein
MSLLMTAAPAVEPITLAEAKLHCRIDGTSEDAYVASLIVTSRLQIEAALGLGMITQSWRWLLDAWPTSGKIELPMRPVQSVEQVAILHPNGGASPLLPSSYRLDGHADPARIILDITTQLPPRLASAGILVDFTAGFGPTAADVPEPIRHATLLLVAHWYECREPTAAGSQPLPIPSTIDAALAPYRPVRL